MKTGFGLARLKIEGAPCHPEDIYAHCGCKKCDKSFIRQGRAYWAWIKRQGYKVDITDPWCPLELK